MTTKKLFLLLTLLALSFTASANDGVYYVNGNQLVPLQENDIAVAREVLTISLDDDGYASVDVLYELDNRGREKTIDMGFEASLPYNSGDEFSPQGIHPRIKDFTVSVNGQALSHRNGVVRGSVDGEPSDFRQLNLKQWHFLGKEAFEDGIYQVTNGRDTISSVAYAYYFKATLKPGKNIVHHTYRYQMSNGVGRAFEVPYWLTPITRWANHQVDDFTLRICANNTAKHFYVLDDALQRAAFKVTSGKGKVRTGVVYDTRHYTEVSLRNATVECHISNFKPEEEISINSADQLYLAKEDPNADIACFYDRAYVTMFFFDERVSYRKFYGREANGLAEQEELEKRIYRNLPYANRGYVFKDARLQRYFSSKWWYMPDEQWQMSDADFQQVDRMYIDEFGK